MIDLLDKVSITIRCNQYFDYPNSYWAYHRYYNDNPINLVFAGRKVGRIEGEDIEYDITEETFNILREHDPLVRNYNHIFK